MSITKNRVILTVQYHVTTTTHRMIETIANNAQCSNAELTNCNSISNTIVQMIENARSMQLMQTLLDSSITQVVDGCQQGPQA